MQVNISKKLIQLYKEQHKNYDYAVDFILDSMDPNSLKKCFKLVNNFELDGEKDCIEVSDELIQRILSDLNVELLPDKITELLIWMGAAFPEI